MNEQEKQAYLQEHFPELLTPPELTREDVTTAMGSLIMEKLALSKQFTLTIDKLIEVMKTNESLRETLATLQSSHKPPK